jgi:hypothetical protein
VTRNTFLDAADAVVALIREPAVAHAWSKPSALPKMSVSALCAHLTFQIRGVAAVLREPAGPDAPITVLEHYARVDWVNTDIDSPTNTGIRERAQVDAAGGIDEVIARTIAAIAELRTVLPQEPADRIVYLPWTRWSLLLDDFLTTRLLEIAVHSDDLAVSVGIPTPELPGGAINPVLQLLLELSVRRHGPTTVLRALSRAERATDIAAF